MFRKPKMHPISFSLAAAVALSVPLLAGCIQEMANQPRLEPLEYSDFFADGRGSRELVPGTVSRPERLARFEDIELPSEHFLTGLQQGEPARELPPEIREEWSLAQLLRHGRERYDIYCVHCHDLTGTGNGMVPQRGFPSPPTYHSERLRQAALGHFFRVIEAGYGQMPAHGALVAPTDRWAIATYIRALQLSQHAEAAQLEPNDLDQLEAAGSPVAPAASTVPAESEEPS